MPRGPWAHPPRQPQPWPQERVRVQLPPGRAVSVRGAGFVRFVVSFKQSQRPSGAGATALHTRGHLGPEEQSARPRAAQPGGGVGSEPRKPGSLAASRDAAGSCRRAQGCAPSSAALSLSHRGPRLSRGLMTQFPSRAGYVSLPRPPPPPPCTQLHLFQPGGLCTQLRGLGGLSLSTARARELWEPQGFSAAPWF